MRRFSEGRNDSREYGIRNMWDDCVILGRITLEKLTFTTGVIRELFTPPEDEETQGHVLPFPGQESPLPEPPADPRISHVRILEGDEAKAAERRKSVTLFDQDASDDEIQ